MDGIAAVTARINEIRALVQPAPVQARVAASSFDRALAEATAVSDAAGPDLARTSGGGRAALAGLGRPPGLAGSVPVSDTNLRLAYENGGIPAEALTPLGVGEHRLAAPAAKAFSALREAAARDGIELGITDSYRSYDEQVDLARRKGLYSEGGLAAKPGTSDHGWGRSLDLDLAPPAQAWMRTHAQGFGFSENVAREPWHWTYQAARR